jgi:hypothetical protein
MEIEILRPGNLWNRERYNQLGENPKALSATHFATAEVYEIVQQLPESDGEYQYKIKSLDERCAQLQRFTTSKPRQPLSVAARRVGWRVVIDAPESVYCVLVMVRRRRFALAALDPQQVELAGQNARN